jgi:hypothetical protein
MTSYRIARRLSAAAGVVEAFLGIEAETGRPVVAKRLVSPWAREGKDFEARFAAVVESYRSVPGLTEWLLMGWAKDSLWLVQGLVDGEGLRHVLNALAAQGKGFIAPNEGLAVVGRLASLVATLHGRDEPLVHADICASTVLLTPEGELLLTDPGLTRCLSVSPTSGPPRAEPYTIAPEQLAGQADPATDVFRIGLLLYELAVGHPLFFAADAVQALVQCQRFTGVALSDVAQVPEPWRSLLVRMLAVEPGDRPEAAEVDEVLRKAAQDSGWGHLERDISQLVRRAGPDRHSLAQLARGGTQELVLAPAPVLRVAVSTPPAGGAAAPMGAGRPQVSGVHVSVSASSDPALQVVLAPAPTPSGTAPQVPRPSGSLPAVVGRITTRKMLKSELDAARAEAALPEPRPSSPAPPPDVDAPLDERVGALLVEHGVLSPAQLAEASQSAARSGGTLLDALDASGAANEDAIVAAVAGLTRTPHTTWAKLARLPPPAEALQKVPLELARQLDLVPLGLKGGNQLLVAMKDPLDASAQARLKAATGLRSVVAVRAGDHAIRRTRNRFYTGQGDDVPDWLEHAARRFPSRPPFPRSSASTSGEVPVVTGALEPPPTPGLAASVSLDSTGGRLALALLKMLDDRGPQALSLARLAAGLARRLGATEAEAEHVRFAAAALCTANFLDGRSAHDVPGLASVSSVLGEPEWNAVEPLISHWLAWPSDWPPTAGAQAVCLAFCFATHLGGLGPRTTGLAAGLGSFRPPAGVARIHLDALAAELGMPGA